MNEKISPYIKNLYRLKSFAIQVFSSATSAYVFVNSVYHYDDIKLLRRGTMFSRLLKNTYLIHDAKCNVTFMSSSDVTAQRCPMQTINYGLAIWNFYADDFIYVAFKLYLIYFCHREMQFYVSLRSNIYILNSYVVLLFVIYCRIERENI